MFSLMRFALLFVLALASGVVPSLAQGQPIPDLDRSRYSPAAYFSYSEPGDVTILVNVWGTVRFPGLYEVPVGTRLNTLYSLAGGVETGARTRRQIREVSVRLMRPAGEGEATVVYEQSQEGELVAPSSNPALQGGDTLLIDTVVRQRFGWRDVVPVVNAAAVLLLALERGTTLFGGE